MIESILPLFILILVGSVVVWLFRPAQGLFWRWQRARRVTRRVRREDALKHLHRCERNGPRPTLESLAGALQSTANEAAQTLSDLEAHHLVSIEAGAFRLTPEGQEYALHVIRAHRMWERYLADSTGIAQEEWHERAEQAEHDLSPAAIDALAFKLGHPTHDPHGDPIPTPTGDLVAHGGRPLSSLPLNAPLRIVHLEDEPEVIYSQLAAEGLHPGQEVFLLEVSAHRVRFWAEGEEHILAPIVAANISAVPVVRRNGPEVETGERLSALAPGKSAEIVGISLASRGSERRRFMDLGILPGTRITAELTSPSGDPTAFRIRGALIALRREQADLITVRGIE